MTIAAGPKIPVGLSQNMIIRATMQAGKVNALRVSACDRGQGGCWEGWRVRRGAWRVVRGADGWEDALSILEAAR